MVRPDIADSFVASKRRGIEDTQSRQGYDLLIGSLDDWARKGQFVDVVDAGQVDGLPLRQSMFGKRSPPHEARLRLPATFLVDDSTGPAPKEHPA